MERIERKKKQSWERKVMKAMEKNGRVKRKWRGGSDRSKRCGWRRRKEERRNRRCEWTVTKREKQELQDEVCQQRNHRSAVTEKMQRSVRRKKWRYKEKAVIKDKKKVKCKEGRGRRRKENRWWWSSDEKRQ